MKKIVTIEMDKARNLKFGMNALIELEKELGKPLTELSEGGVSLETLRSMVYVGLKWEDKKLSRENIGDLMDEVVEKHGMEYLSEKINVAVQGAFGGSAAPSGK